MSGKLLDALFGIVVQFRWKYILLLLVAFFVGSWTLMYHFEPNNELVSPRIYWWYFVTDNLRSGSSGYLPVTTGGRLVSMVSVFAGGICFVAVLCKTIAYVFTQSQNKQKGKAPMKHKDHIVLLGYRKGETDSLIHQLTSDPVYQHRPIVLCSNHLEENPFPEIDFVRGDTASDEVLGQANAAEASVIVISGHMTDERTTMVGIAANSCARNNPHIVAYFDQIDNARFLHKVNPRIECVSSLRPMLIAQAVCNPGSTKIIHDLVSLDNAGTNYRINIPLGVPEISFHLLITTLHMEYRAIAIGYAKSHDCNAESHLNPAMNTMIKGGMSIFYIAEHPIDRIIDWDVLRRAEVIDETIFSRV